MIRKYLEKAISKVPDDNIAVLLSGGVDSMTIAFAADSIGKKVSAYTFHLGGQPSYDAMKALEYADKFGWKGHLTIVPADVDTLKDQWKNLANNYDCRKKTHFECTYPFLYVYPNIKETHVFSGLGADSSYGLSKTAMMHFRHTKELFDSYRHKAYALKPGGYDQQILLAKQYGKVYNTPYMEKEVKEYFLGFTWDQINKPFEKALIVNDFRDYFDRIGKWRKHTNLQLDSKINLLFEKLIDEPEINFKNRKRIMDIARDWHERKQLPTLFSE
jgi:asparagine synthetase B (glutamine-hydrolysing)